MDLTDCEKDSKLLVDPKLERKTIIMQVDLEIAEKLEKLSANSDWNELMKEYLELRGEKLQKEKEEIESKKVASRSIPVKIKRYVHATTNGTCCFPGCRKKAEALHHTDRFALTKKHDPDKIRPLCFAHHDLAHRGLIQNEDLPPQYWWVRKYPEKYNIKNIIDERVVERKYA